MPLFDRKDNPEKNERDDDPVISGYIANLGSEDKRERQEAVTALLNSGKPAILPLLRALNDDDAAIRGGSAEVLGLFGEPALPTLMKLLFTGNERVRDGAARAVGKMGTHASGKIREALKDKNYKTRRGAMQALGYLKLPLDEDIGLLLSGLEDENREVSRQAAISLSAKRWKPSRKRQAALYYYGTGDLDAFIARGDEAARIISAEIKDPEAGVRCRAASLLGRIDSKETIGPLVELLKDKKTVVRRSAVKAIAEKSDKKYNPYLVKSLYDPDTAVRTDVAWALDKGEWKPSDSNEYAQYLIVKEKWGDLVQMGELAIPCLINCLKDKNPNSRLRCTEALRAMGNQGYSAINDALKSDDPALKKAAAEAALRIKEKNAGDKRKIKQNSGPVSPGNSVEAEIKKHKEGLSAKDTQSSQYWMEILSRAEIQPSRAVRFAKALSDPNGIVRIAAVENLKQNGEEATECLLYVLKDKDESVRIAAIEALGDIHDKRAAPELAKLLKEDNQRIRTASARALGMIGEPKSIPFLTEFFSTENPEFRKEVALAVAAMGTSSLPYLKMTLRNSDIRTTITALESVEQVADPIAISLAVRMLNDRRSEIRNRAVIALHWMSKTMFDSLMDEAMRIRIQGNEIEKQGIIIVLAGVNESEAKNVLAEFTGDSNEKIRKLAFEYAGYIPENQKIKSSRQKTDSPKDQEDDIKRLIKKLKSSDRKIQAQAAERIAGMGEGAVRPLIKSLNDDNPEFLNLVAEILTGMGGSATKHMIREMETGKPSIRAIMVQNLAKIPGKETIPALCKVLHEDDDPVIRMVAAESLGPIGDETVLDYLIDSALNDENTRVKSAAITSLGYFRNERAIEALIRILDSEDEILHEVTTKSLKNSGNSAIPVLRDALLSGRYRKDSIVSALEALSWVPETKQEIICYLFAKGEWDDIEKIGGQATGVLAEILNDDDPESRINAVRMIDKTGGEESIELLIPALGDTNSRVRKSAESALIKRGSGAVRYLERTVADTGDPNIRTFALKLLNKIEE